MQWNRFRSSLFTRYALALALASFLLLVSFPEPAKCGDAETSLKQAKDLWWDEQYSEAAGLYEQALTRNPAVYGLNDYETFADCYEQLEQYDKAAAVYETAAMNLQGQGVQLDEMYIALGDIYLSHMNENQKALNSYLKILPGSRTSHWYANVALCYEGLGMSVDAVRTYETGIRETGRAIGVYMSFRDYLVRTGDLQRAEALSYEAIVFHESNPLWARGLYSGLIDIYEKQDRSPELIEWAQQRLALAEFEIEKAKETPTSSNWPLIITVVVFSALLVLIGAFILVRKRRHGESY